jgi:hypothetical protein
LLPSPTDQQRCNSSLDQLLAIAFQREESLGLTVMLP